MACPECEQARVISRQLVEARRATTRDVRFTFGEVDDQGRVFIDAVADPSLGRERSKRSRKAANERRHGAGVAPGGRLPPQRAEREHDEAAG